MSDFFKNTLKASPAYSKEPEVARAYAVAAALEVIRAQAGSSSDKGRNLEYEFADLSKLADQIQAAMEVSNK